MITHNAPPNPTPSCELPHGAMQHIGTTATTHDLCQTGHERREMTLTYPYDGTLPGHGPPNATRRKRRWRWRRSFAKPITGQRLSISTGPYVIITSTLASLTPVYVYPSHYAHLLPQFSHKRVLGFFADFRNFIIFALSHILLDGRLALELKYLRFVHVRKFALRMYSQ